MVQKVFRTHRQLLNILRRRGVIIKKGSAGSRVISILEQENYYNIINGYKDLFIDRAKCTSTNEVYKANTEFNEIFALYNFDRAIRLIYLKYIFELENNFKSVLSHHFSKQYGPDNYLKLENFNNVASTDLQILKKIAAQNKLDISKDIAKIQMISAEENVASVIRLLGDIQQEIARQLAKHHAMVTHYMTKHGYIPLWVLVNVLTFGKVTTFYYNMKDKDKAPIAKHFKLQPFELHKYMNMLGFARNKCAHDERLYNINFTQKIHTKSIPYFSKLGLPKDKSGSYTMGINDAYAIAIIFKQLLSKSDFKEFVLQMETEFKKLTKQLKTISISDVQNKMGYPSNWKDLIKF